MWSAGTVAVGRIAVDDPFNVLEVGRMTQLGAATDGAPVIAAADDRVWVALGRQLLAIDPVSLAIEGRVLLAAPVTALAVDPTTHELVGADADQLRHWAIDSSGTIAERASASLPLPVGLGAISRIVLP